MPVANSCWSIADTSSLYAASACSINVGNILDLFCSWIILSFNNENTEGETTC